MKITKAIGKIWLIIEMLVLAICGAFALWSAHYTWIESHFDSDVLVNELTKRFLP